MGLACSTTCLDCGAEAPEVGDFGYIGYPSASRERGEEEAPNFGYLFEGFAAIGLVTYELDSFRSFLEAHEGHRLHTSADGESVFGDGEDDVEDDEALDEDDEENDEEWSEDDEDDWSEDEDDNWSEEDAKLYPAARYVLRCDRCGAAFTSQHQDNIKRSEPRQLSAEQIGLFLSRVGEELGSETFYRAEPVSPEDLESIADFLEEHREHSPEASLAPAKD